MRYDIVIITCFLIYIPAVFLPFEIAYICIRVTHFSIFQNSICRSVGIFLIAIVSRVIHDVFHTEFTSTETFVTFFYTCRSVWHIFCCPGGSTFGFVGSITGDEWFPETRVIDTVKYLHGILCSTYVWEFTSSWDVTFTSTYIIALIYGRIIKMHLISIASPCWFIIRELSC